ncbi:MAG TPA: LysR substrate-binding domain-containing protein, partial [Myxococcota bacterium]|nr:LysR substrate-binding domain-containing protein [Myxococcota bacterium]
VCVTASDAVAAFVLPPLVAELRVAHPRIELEIVASNETRDLRRREADIAIRHYRPDDPELVARRVRDVAYRLYAAPAYLERLGWPASAAELSRADFIGFDRTEAMTSGLAAIGVHLTDRSFPLVTTSHVVQWELAKQGLGVCVMLDEVGDREPAVRRALDDLPPLPVPTWLTCHRGLRTSRRVRAVFDLLADRLAPAGGAPASQAAP